MPKIFQKNLDISNFTTNGYVRLRFPVMQDITRQGGGIFQVKSQDYDERYSVCPELRVRIFQNQVIAESHPQCSDPQTAKMLPHPFRRDRPG